MWTRVKEWLYGTSSSSTSPIPNPVTAPAGVTSQFADADVDEVVSQEESLSESAGSTQADPVPQDTVADLDALGQFQQDLKAALLRDHTALLWWKENKEQILKVDALLCQEEEAAQNQLMAHKKSAGEYLKERLVEIKDRIKLAVEPADLAMDDLMAHFRPHLEALHERMNKLCRQLMDHQQALAARTPHESRQIEVRLCNAGIAILDEMISLNSSIQDEITYCLESEKRGEKALASFAQFLICMITKMPAPDLDFDFSEHYRVALNNRIEGEKEQLDIFESKIEGGLKKARASLEKSQQRIKADRESVKSNPSSMFARKDSKQEAAQPVMAVANKL